MSRFQTGWIVLGLVAVIFPVTEAQAAPRRTPQKLLPPRVLEYDEETDTLRHQRDINARDPAWRDGSETSYYGNRLDQYRYIGPRGRGGIYDALRLYYYEERKLDPGKYRYRYRFR